MTERSRKVTNKYAMLLKIQGSNDDSALKQLER